MAGVVVTMSGDEARLFRAMQKVVDQQDKLNSKLKDTAKNSDEAGKKSKDAFERSAASIDKLQSSVIKYAASLGTISTAVQLIKTGWEQIRKEQESGLTQLQRTLPQDRRLLQVSNAEQFDTRRNQADELAAKFGVDRAVVREVMFAGISEGFEKAVPAIIAANQAVDPIAAAGVAGQAPALFKGTIEALEAVNLTLKAAEASRLNFEQIAASLPQASEGGSIANATAEETLAVLSVLASEFKSGDTAADRIKMFATRAGISEEFAGQGIIGPLEKLMAMDEKTRRAYLGDSQELNVAYVKMSENLSLIKQRIVEFNKEGEAFAEGNSFLSQKVGIAGVDPRFIALMNEAKSKQLLESQQAIIDGQSGAGAEAARNIINATMLNDPLLGRIIGATLGFVVPSVSMEQGVSGVNPQAVSEAVVGISRYLSSVIGMSSGTPGITVTIVEQFSRAVKTLENAANTLQASGGNGSSAARAAASGASF